MTVHISRLIAGIVEREAPAPSGPTCQCEGCSLGHRICNSRELAWLLPRPKLRARLPIDEAIGWYGLHQGEHGGDIKLCDPCGIAYGKRRYRVRRLEVA